MSRKGQRPHTWLIKDPIRRQQHLSWQRMKAQAIYRKEEWLLSFEEFLNIWEGMWDQRGRAPEQYCLTRDDCDGPWDNKNTILMNRREHLQRQVEFKGGRFGAALKGKVKCV